MNPKERLVEYGIDVEGDNEDILAQAVALFRRLALPDLVEHGTDFYGRSYIRAVHRLPVTVPDAWGVMVKEDVIRVRSWVGLNVRLEEEIEKARVTPLMFFHVDHSTRAMYLQVCKALEEANIVDIEDYRGPRIMAYYPLEG